MSIITEAGRLKTHPGEVLREEFLGPLGVSRNKLSRETGLPLSAVSAIASEQRAVTADTALRLARFFGTSAEFWLNLQCAYDLSEARQRAGDAVTREVRPLTNPS